MTLGHLNDDGTRFVFTDRACETSEGRLVVETDPDARWLYAIPGQEIDRPVADRFGLVKAPAVKRSTKNKE